MRAVAHPGVTVTVRDDQGHLWGYRDEQLKWSWSGKPIFEVDFDGKIPQEAAVIRAIRTAHRVTVEVKAADRVIESERFDLSAVEARDRFIAAGLQKVRRHDPSVCTTRPAKGPRLGCTNPLTPP